MSYSPTRAVTTKVIAQANLTDSTTVIPTLEEPKSKKKPIVWPWIAVIGLVIVSGLAIVAAMVIGAIQTEPEPTFTPISPTQTPTPTTSPTASSVFVFSTDVVGLPLDQVTLKLEALGLFVEPVAGETVDALDPKVNTVYDAAPLGSMPPGTTVRLLYYTPAAEPTPSPSQPQ
jgi:serine/threonine-protein kinase